MADEKFPIGIKKLKTKLDYPNWSYSMKSYLQEIGLWKCVNGTDVSNETNMHKARNRIVWALDESIISHIKKCETPKEMWLHLEKMFAKVGLESQIEMIQTLISIKLEDCETTTEYVSKITSAAEALEAMEFEVGDKWLVSLLLAGLPKSYKTMIMALANCGTKLTADFIKDKVIQEVADPCKGTEEALYMSNHKNNFKKKFDKFNQHKKFEKYKIEDYNNNNKGPRCFKCNKYGHFAKNCRTNQEKSNFAPERDDVKSQDTSEKNVLVWVAGGDVYDRKDWYIDSGATQHMTANRSLLNNYRSIQPKLVEMADGRLTKALGQGDVNMTVKCEKELVKIKLSDVLYVPDVGPNLVSVHVLSKLGMFSLFGDKTCDIINKNSKQVLAKAVKCGKMYKFESVITEKANVAQQEDISPNLIDLWHRRLAHMNRQDMQKLPEMCTGYKITKENSKPCESCTLGKSARKPFPREGSRATEVLQLIHSDICESEVASVNGANTLQHLQTTTANLQLYIF